MAASDKQQFVLTGLLAVMHLTNKTRIQTTVSRGTGISASLKAEFTSINLQFAHLWCSASVPEMLTLGLHKTFIALFHIPINRIPSTFHLWMDSILPPVSLAKLNEEQHLYLGLFTEVYWKDLLIST